jgi:transcriptional regulator with XRE-family HTH domain
MNITPQAVKAARKAAGLTVQQAADAVHSRYRTWQDWEHGKRPPDAARYRLFCHLAGIEQIPFGKLTDTSLAGRIDKLVTR